MVVKYKTNVIIVSSKSHFFSPLYSWKIAILAVNNNLLIYIYEIGYVVMGFNATFNNVSVISWQSFLLWRKPEYTEKTTDQPQVTDILNYIMLYRVQLSGAGFKLTTSVVIGTDCIGSCKSSYYAITTVPIYGSKHSIHLVLL
jgi:hypothetical protein